MTKRADAVCEWGTQSVARVGVRETMSEEVPNDVLLFIGVLDGRHSLSGTSPLATTRAFPQSLTKLLINRGRVSFLEEAVVIGKPDFLSSDHGYEPDKRRLTLQSNKFDQRRAIPLP